MTHITPMTPRRVFCGAALMLMAALSHEALAQNQSPTPQAAPTPEFLQITVVSVKPEMMAEFQNFMKNTTNPALKKGGIKWREVWQSTGAAGDAFEYILVTPVAKLADFDGPGPLEKGLGAQGVSAWQTKAGSLVNSVRRFIIRTRPDLSFAPQRSGPPKLAVVHFVHVAPNRNADYENYLKNDFVPAMKQAGVTYLVSQTIFGGNGNEYITLTMRDQIADGRNKPVSNYAPRTLGSSASALMQKLLPAHHGVRTTAHEQKLVRALRGRKVRISHGLAESLEQLAARDRRGALRELSNGARDASRDHRRRERAEEQRGRGEAEQLVARPPDLRFHALLRKADARRSPPATLHPVLGSPKAFPR